MLTTATPHVACGGESLRCHQPDERRGRGSITSLAMFTSGTGCSIKARIRLAMNRAARSCASAHSRGSRRWGSKDFPASDGSLSLCVGVSSPRVTLANEQGGFDWNASSRNR